MEGRQRLRYCDRLDCRFGIKFLQFCGNENFVQMDTSPPKVCHATPGDFLDWLVVAFVRRSIPLDIWPFIFRDMAHETHHSQ